MNEAQQSGQDYEQVRLDPAGNVTRRTLRDGLAIDYGYDALGRLTTLTPPNGEAVQSYGYDLQGRLTVSGIPGYAISYGHDALGRVTSQSDPFFGTTAFAHDAAGRMTRIDYPGGGLFVDYDHLVTGEVSAVRENGAITGLLARYGYDALGRRTRLDRGNGTFVDYQYDRVGRLTRVSNEVPASPARNIDLILTHNPASQIAARRGNNPVYSFTAHADASRTDNHDGRNRVVETGATPVTHDTRGNLTSYAGAAYGYTADNQLTLSPGSAYAYDPTGRLWHETVPNSVLTYTGEQLIQEMDGSTGLIRRRYVPGAGLDEPLVWYEGPGLGDRRWYHSDERGSIVAVSDAGGGALAVNRYDDHGVPQAGNLGRFGYTGQQWLAELGMYHYRARMYNPALGRFMQEDPIGYEGGPNLYAYVRGDPVNRIDPFGLQDRNSGPNPRVIPIDPNRRVITVTGDRCRVFDCNAGDRLGVISQAGPGWQYGQSGGGGGTSAPQPQPQMGLLDRARGLYCSLPSLGFSTAARGYYVVGGGFAFDIAFDPQSGRAAFSGGIDVGVGVGGEVRFSGGNSATVGRGVADGPSGSVGVNANVRLGPLALGVSETLIGRDGPGFGGVSGGLRPGGTGATVNANIGGRGGFGLQVLPSCGAR